MDPLVSVIMPFYNEEKYIEKSVQCILEQTYKNLEIILIDDASNDKSFNIIKDIEDNRIKIIRLEKNMGRAIARNKGIQAARGDFIALMDADDQCELTRIEKQVSVILANGVNTVCGTWVKILSSNSEKIKKLPVNNVEIIKGFERKNNRVTFVAGTMLASSRILKKYLYREKFKYFEDWDLLLRLHESKEVIFINVPEVLYTYNLIFDGTKRNQDWLNYNVFARDCQRRRLNGKKELNTIDEFNIYLQRNYIDYIYYYILKILIQIKNRIIMD